MTRYQVEQANLEDDAALRLRMAQDWMRGNLSVSFRREPSYFAGSRLQGDAVQVVKVVDMSNGTLVGMGARLKTQLYINGKIRCVGLLTDLRAAPDVRGGTLLARKFNLLKQTHESDPVDFYLSVIMEGNTLAQQVLTSGRCGLPTYHDCGLMLTPALHLDLPKPALRVANVLFRRALASDTDALTELFQAAAPRRQFAPDYRCVLTEQGLPNLTVADFFVAERGSQLLGCIAAWDQQSLRQTHIEAYSAGLALMRPWYNALARISPFKPMPAIGEKIPYLYLAALTLRTDDLTLFRGLLRHVYRELRSDSWHYAIISIHQNDPLAVVLAEYRAILSAGRLYAVHYADGAAAVAALDGRVPYFDMSRI